MGGVLAPAYNSLHITKTYTHRAASSTPPRPIIHFPASESDPALLPIPTSSCTLCAGIPLATGCALSSAHSRPAQHASLVPATPSTRFTRIVATTLHKQSSCKGWTSTTRMPWACLARNRVLLFAVMPTRCSGYRCSWPWSAYRLHRRSRCQEMPYRARARAGTLRCRRCPLRRPRRPRHRLRHRFCLLFQPPARACWTPSPTACAPPTSRRRVRVPRPALPTVYIGATSLVRLHSHSPCCCRSICSTPNRVGTS